MSINKSLKGKLFAVIFDTEKMIFLVLLLLGFTAKGKNILQTQLCPLSFFFISYSGARCLGEAS